MDSFITFMPIHPQKTWDYWALKIIKDNMEKRNGGGGGIRTLEGLSPLPVFKTGAFNRSATPPQKKRRSS